MTRCDDCGGFFYAFGGDTPGATLFGLLMIVLTIVGIGLLFDGLAGLFTTSTASDLGVSLLSIITGGLFARIGLTTGF